MVPLLTSAVHAAAAAPAVCVQAARRKLANAVVCGYISHTDRSTHLNPPDTDMLSHADKLIVLSHGTTPEMAPGGSTAAGLDVQALQQRLQAAQPPAPTPKAIGAALGSRRGSAAAAH